MCPQDQSSMEVANIHKKYDARLTTISSIVLAEANSVRPWGGDHRFVPCCNALGHGRFLFLVFTQFLVCSDLRMILI